MVRPLRSKLSEKPTWGVVATVKEQRNLLIAFVSYYASIGADCIYVYLDEDDVQTRDQIATVPGCQVVLADPAYFRNEWNCGRPKSHRRRQRLNATNAYRRADVDWLLHVDADEFLICPDFRDFLAKCPEDVETIRILNGERVFAGGAARPTVFDGWQLLPGGLKPWQRKHFVNDDVRRFTDSGFCGHMLGKSVTRTGRDYRLGIHAPLKRHAFDQITSSDPALCHFDGLTALHWMLKLLRYKDAGLNTERTRSSQFRYEQIKYLLEAKTDGRAVERLHDSIRVYEPGLLENLQKRGIAAPIDLDVSGAVSRFFPDSSGDLSPECFDLNLREQMAGQYAQLA